jgi:hypothetical protein
VALSDEAKKLCHQDDENNEGNNFEGIHECGKENR